MQELAINKNFFMELQFDDLADVNGGLSIGQFFIGAVIVTCGVVLCVSGVGAVVAAVGAVGSAVSGLAAGTATAAAVGTAIGGAAVVTAKVAAGAVIAARGVQYLASC